MYKYSSGFAGPLWRAGAPSGGLFLETDHATAECALSVRLLFSQESSHVASDAILTVAQCRCVVSETWDRVKGHHRALTNTRVAHAECAAARPVAAREEGAATTMQRGLRVTDRRVDE